MRRKKSLFSHEYLCNCCPLSRSPKQLYHSQLSKLSYTEPVLQLHQSHWHQVLARQSILTPAALGGFI